MSADPGHKQHPIADFLMGLFWRTPAETVAERARRRCTVYLIPYLFFLYILAFLDRVNISVAAFGMQLPESEGGVGFNKEIIGFGFGMFFWGYWILEVPSTRSVLTWGARWVFVRILLLWGLSCTFIGVIGTPFASALFSWLPYIPEESGFIVGCDWLIDLLLGWTVRLFAPDWHLFWLGGLAHFFNGLSTNAEYQFYFFRFMLGFFEGGFFPSVIMYLALWFRPVDRAKAIAVFMSAIPFSNIIGTPISGWILTNDWLDLPGWRWIFILQGLLPVLAGFATLFFLPDRPAKAPWLPPEEKTYLVSELEKEQQARAGHHGIRIWIGQLGIVLLLTAFYFCMNVVSYGLMAFLPQIIKSQMLPVLIGAERAALVLNPPPGAERLLSQRERVYYDFLATLVTSPLYLLALVAMLLNGWHSDRTGERIRHVAMPMLCMGLALYIIYGLEGLGFVTVLATIVLVGPCLFAHLPAFWPLPTMFMGATAAASAIGFINMIGNFGGSVGPYIVGNASVGQPGFADALFRLAAFPLLAAAIILLVGLLKRKQLRPH